MAQQQPEPVGLGNILVVNLTQVSLEKLIRAKLEVLFRQQKSESLPVPGLYQIVLEQMEKPLLELALQATKGNQVKAAELLGLNRNTLKKKMDAYGLSKNTKNSVKRLS